MSANWPSIDQPRAADQCATIAEAEERTTLVTGCWPVSSCEGGSLAELTPEQERRIRSVRRRVAAVSWVAALIAITGFIVRPSLDPLWAFMLVFSAATIPRWLLSHWRGRGRR
jgi:Flp pilus assembly protein TadB